MIIPPAGGESSYQSADVCIQLGNWAKSTRLGKSFNSSVALVLPSVAILSPSDRRPSAETKMLEWTASGVVLAWLIDGDARTVTIYRPHLPPETRSNILIIAAEGPLTEFTLDLTDIWAGL